MPGCFIGEGIMMIIEGKFFLTATAVVMLILVSVFSCFAKSGDMREDII